ncbi:hypothetical protein E4U54_004696 [Claviceps lovelessii]|nr:hypothetical protein E4U54_004696 [Claviceps lovelessii]
MEIRSTEGGDLEAARFGGRAAGTGHGDGPIMDGARPDWANGQMGIGASASETRLEPAFGSWLEGVDHWEQTRTRCRSRAHGGLELAWGAAGWSLGAVAMDIERDEADEGDDGR